TCLKSSYCTIEHLHPTLNPNELKCNYCGWRIEDSCHKFESNLFCPAKTHIFTDSTEMSSYLKIMISFIVIL
ncbi:MAG: hypothetical protein WCF14_11000, partial [Nitrososphaeraceae archaeon]